MGRGGFRSPEKKPRPRFLGHLLLLLLVAALFLLPGCQPGGIKGILGQEASSHRFSLVSWEIQNLPSKLIKSLLGLESIPPPDEREAILDHFFELGDELNRAEWELVQEVALQGAQSAEVERLESQVEIVRDEYDDLAPKVEAIIEHDIEHQLRDEGLGFRFIKWTVIFPPMLFVFERLPKILIASPRDHIERLDDLLISPDMTTEEIEALEDSILQNHNLSAIVEGLGGYSTYPSMVQEKVDFYRSVAIAAHEWTHSYLFFYPLGRAYDKGGAVQEINETVADIIEIELADSISLAYGRETPPSQPPPAEDGPTFDFVAEMRETRLTLDDMLAEGSIEEAERYLEERRQLFVAAGFAIRKLNQAYFAFHGTYAFSPASVSPVGEQLEELRGYFPTLGEFLAAVRRVSTHDKLLALLAEKRAEQSSLEGGFWPEPATELATLVG